MSFRDFLWNYPSNIKSLYSKLAPLSYILLFSTVSILFVVYILIPSTQRMFKQSKSTMFVEGIVGNVESLNPLYLTNNQAQRDVQSLIFTQLIKMDASGKPVPSLAVSWKAFDGGLSYVFTLSDKYFWHDGERVDADDVVFTFQKSIDLASKYSENTLGQSILNLKVERVSDFEVKFVLDEINATFFESVAVDIVPKHILEKANFGSFALSRFGQMPVGSGPYKVEKFDSLGITLIKNQLYPVLPNIQTIQFKFYPTYKDAQYAFRLGDINSIGSTNLEDLSFIDEYGNTYTRYSFHLTNRKKIMFFNLRKKELANASLRKGILQLIDKEKLLLESSIDGVVSNSPLPITSWAYISSLGYLKYSPKEADIELKLAGYTKNTETGLYTSVDGKILALELIYLENEMNTRLVETLKEFLESEGVLLDLVGKNYDQITKEVLASRDFELILYEIEVSVDPDQYNLWHSLRINFPDLNISGYKFNRVDVYLERGRQLLSQKNRLVSYESFQKAMINDVPAIFLYEPKYFYVVPGNLKGFQGTEVRFPQDRFSNIIEWRFE